jgi:hypothetical protein
MAVHDRMTERVLSASQAKAPDGKRLAVEMAVMASSRDGEDDLDFPFRSLVRT